MTRVEYNGGCDVFVGLSTEPKPTAEKDQIAEGALLVLRDQQKMQIFSGNDSDGWSDLVTFS